MLSYQRKIIYGPFSDFFKKKNLRNEKVQHIDVGLSRTKIQIYYGPNKIYKY